MKKRLGQALAALGLLLLLGGALSYQAELSPEALKTRYAKPGSAFLPIGGMAIHVLDEGPSSDSLPLLLLHGTSASLHTWDSLCALFGGQRRLIRFDLPAFGLTGPDPAHDYSIARYVAILDSLVARKGLRQMVLVGNSLGGNIAWHYALARPGHVAQLVLIDAAGYPFDAPTGGAIGFKLAQIPVLNRLLTRITPKFLVRRSLEDVYGDDGLVSAALVQRYYDLLCREGNRAAFVARMKQGWPDDSALIRQIKTPTLIIWGTADQLTPPSMAERFAKDLENSQLHWLEGVGHVPMEEAPAQVFAAYQAFAATIGQ